MNARRLQLAVGRRIRTLRKARRWTIEHLAELAAIDASYLSNVERGVQNPSLGIVARIASALEVTVAMLVDVDEDLAPRVILRRVASLAGKLPPEQLRAFARLLEILTVDRKP